MPLLTHVIDDIDDQHRNPNMNNKDHQVGQLTINGAGDAKTLHQVHLQLCFLFLLPL